MKKIINKNYFEVVRPGVNSTFQDFGRNNFYHIGIPFSGAMDNRNFLLANTISNNSINSPVLEFAYQGPKLKYKGDNLYFNVTGDINFQIIRKNKIIKCNCYENIALKDNDYLDILSTNRSVYGYLSVAGQFKLDYYLDSCSINTKAQIGANEGKKLAKDQIIEIYNIRKNISQNKIEYLNSKIENIRVLTGPHFDYFSEEAKKLFFKENFLVTKLSDRMGMRLDGPSIENIKNTNIKSEGLVKGVIQIPADGKPIIMLSDHGTVGGYPKIGVVISSDYDKLVQLPPGSKIKFKKINLKDAETTFKLYDMETKNLISKAK